MADYLTRIEESLSAARYRVIALDLFDTLVLRRAGSLTALWSELAGVAIERRLWPGSVSDYLACRRLAEQQSRSTRPPARDPSLAEIYGRFPVSPAQRQKLMRLEAEMDGAGLVAATALIRQLGLCLAPHQALAILSDTYYDRAWICRYVLPLLGPLAPAVRHIFASSEEGVNKASGLLFQRLLEQVEGRAEDILHIGDDVRSDGLMARQHGLRTCLFAPGEEIRQLLHRESHLEFSLHRLESWRRRVLAERPRTDGMGWWLGAALLTPVLWGYALAVEQAAKSHACEVIAPVVRDGYALELALAALRKAGKSSSDVRLLQLSRSALWLASLSDTKARTILSSALDSKGLKLSDLCRLLQLTAPLPVADMALAELARDAVLAFLTAQEDAIVANRLREQERVLRYLHETLTDQPALVVDLGGGGSIFARLATIGWQPKAAMLFYATRRADRLALDVPLTTFVPRHGRGGVHAETLGRAAELIESLLVNRFRTVSHLASGEKKIEPVAVEIALGADEKRLLDQVWNGLEFGLDLLVREPWWAQCIESLSADELVSVWIRLVHLPLSDEIDALCCLHHQDNDGAHRQRPILDRNQIEAIRQQGAIFSWHGYCKNPGAALETMPWPQGMISAVEPRLLSELCGATGVSPAQIAAEKLADRVKAAGLSAVAVYGCGMVCEALLPLLSVMEVEVSQLVDRRAEDGSFLAWGRCVESPLSLAGASGVVVIASAASVRDISAAVAAIAPQLEQICLEENDQR